MADVRRLQIEVPTREDQAIIARRVDELFEIQDEIERLRIKLMEHKTHIWPEETAQLR